MIIITLFQEGKTLRHQEIKEALKKVSFLQCCPLSLSHPLSLKHTRMHFGCRVDHEFDINQSTDSTECQEIEAMRQHKWSDKVN